MDWIRIHENQIKIMLSAEEMKSFHTDLKHLDYGDPALRRMIRQVLEEIKQVSGFDTEGSRVLIRMFPSRGGDCELFVTKLSSLCRDDTESDEENEKGATLSLLHSPVSGDSAPGDSAPLGSFGFEELSRLLAVCRRLLALGYTGNSSAYISDEHRFYLLLEKPEETRYLPYNEFSFISEYGVSESTEWLLDMLGEHCRPICERCAVETLGIL